MISGEINLKMKFEIVVLACVITSAVSIPAIDNSPIKVNLSVKLNNKSSTTESLKQEPTTETLIDSSTTESSIDITTTDASFIISSEMTTVNDESHETTTAAVNDASSIEQKETTEVPTTETPTTEIPSIELSNTAISLQADIETDSAVIFNENDKFTDQNNEKQYTKMEKTVNKETKPRIRGSFKFGMIKGKDGELKSVSKTELESVQMKSSGEMEKKVKNTNQVVGKNSPSKVKENLAENRESEVNTSSDRKIVPAIPQPRVKTKTNSNLTPDERRKGRRYKDIQIVQLESELEENGKYRFNYEGEDGTIVNQSGELKMMDSKGSMGESVQGSYSYKDENTGETYEVKYTADENGYRPVGAHIPTIPPYIARALAWQATAKPWVDPWLVEQENLRKARKAKKLQSTN